jgi:hypothetical protein
MPPTFRYYIKILQAILFIIKEGTILNVTSDPGEIGQKVLSYRIKVHKFVEKTFKMD